MKLSSFTQICCDLRALSESFCAQNLATRKVFAFSDSDDLPATHTPLSILNPRTLHFFEPVSSVVFFGQNHIHQRTLVPHNPGLKSDSRVRRVFSI